MSSRRVLTGLANQCIMGESFQEAFGRKLPTPLLRSSHITPLITNYLLEYLTPNSHTYLRLMLSCLVELPYTSTMIFWDEITCLLRVDSLTEYNPILTIRAPCASGHVLTKITKIQKYSSKLTCG